MKAAGFALRFSSFEDAKTAFEICERETEASLWEGKTVIAQMEISVEPSEAGMEDDFSKEAMEEGSSPFHRICFAIASCEDIDVFEGTCRIKGSPERETVKITAKWDGKVLRFSVRSFDSHKIRYSRIYWEKEGPGEYRKMLFGTEREKDRKDV